MSIFKTQGIIIKSKKISDKNNLYTIFTMDYGKILCNKKFSTREKSLDLGYIINFEIDVREGINIHKIKNIKISAEFTSIGKEFSLINNFLILLNIIDKKIPEKLENKEIFSTLEHIITYKKIDVAKIILIQLKILNILGILDLEHHSITIKKILKFINNNKAQEVLKLTGIDKNLLQQLKEIIKKT